MKFFIDTADTDEIRAASELGLVDGVTTNPSLVAKTGRDFHSVLREIALLVDGPISAEVVASESQAMVAEARTLHAIDPQRIVIKLPLTADGLKATRILTNEGIRTNVTLVFSPLQALLAAKAGAAYVSPFIGRLDDINLDGMDLISDIRQVYDNYGFDTQILAASVRSANHVAQCALVGADVMTAPPAVIKGLASHVLTDKGLEQFMKDWAKTGQKII